MQTAPETISGAVEFPIQFPELDECGGGHRDGGCENNGNDDKYCDCGTCVSGCIREGHHIHHSRRGRKESSATRDSYHPPTATARGNAMNSFRRAAKALRSEAWGYEVAAHNLKHSELRVPNLKINAQTALRFAVRGRGRSGRDSSLCSTRPRSRGRTWAGRHHWSRPPRWLGVASSSRTRDRPNWRST